jgi:4-alpha-glucanotransferase
MLPCGEDLGVVPVCCTKALEELSIPGLEVQRWTRDWGKTYGFKGPESYRKNAVAVISTHDMSPLTAWWSCEAGTVDEEFVRLRCEARTLDFNIIKGMLFDPAHSRHGRLRWRPETTEDRLLEVTGLRREDAWDFLDLHRTAHGEQRAFWEFIGMENEFEARPTTAFVRRTLEKAGHSVSIFSVQLLQDWLALGDPTGDMENRINTPGLVGPQNWSWVCPIPLEKFCDLSLTKTIHEINKITHRL